MKLLLTYSLMTTYSSPGVGEVALKKGFSHTSTGYWYENSPSIGLAYQPRSRTGGRKLMHILI